MYPSKKTFHKNKSYLLGGIILFQGYLINYFYVINNLDNYIYLSVFITFLFFLIAIIDDIGGVSPYLKIIFCCFVSYLVIINDVTLTIKTLNSLSLGILYFPDNIFIIIFFPILCLVIFVNAFNFIDSSDGLSVGLSGLSATFFLVIAMSNGQEPIIYFCAILLGLCIGLYFFNSYPAKLFLGDSGAQTLGFILGAIVF